MICGERENSFIIESRANKPNTSSLKNKFNKDIVFELPEPRIPFPKIKEDVGKLGDSLDIFVAKTKMDVDLGKRRLNSEIKVGKDDKKKDNEKEESKKKHIQME